MESLEIELRKIEDLRRDLSAEIVHQAEEGHYEEYMGYGKKGYYGQSDPSPQRDWIVDKNRVAEPDTRKRRAARKALQQTYQSSEWYSARYAAGIALEFPDGKYYRGSSKVDSEAQSWLDELNTRFEESETRSEAVRDLIYLHRIPHSSGFPIRLLEQLLRNAYKESTDKTEVREIGKELNYSNFRIWVGNLFR